MVSRNLLGAASIKDCIDRRTFTSSQKTTRQQCGAIHFPLSPRISDEGLSVIYFKGQRLQRNCNCNCNRNQRQHLFALCRYTAVLPALYIQCNSYRWLAFWASVTLYRSRCCSLRVLTAFAYSGVNCHQNTQSVFESRMNPSARPAQHSTRVGLTLGRITFSFGTLKARTTPPKIH